jgi:glycosyltransferase involved in cell wall biosynthesis
MNAAVVIPLYNKERYIERALRSVLAQTRRPGEIIVIDDGSTDRGPEIVKGFAAEGVALQAQANAGPSAARNRGLAAARADYAAFLDADDEWRPAFIERLSGFLDRHPEAGFVCCSCLDGRTGRPILPDQEVLPGGIEGLIPHFFRSLHREYFLNPSSALVRRTAIESAGVFDESARLGEDPDFFGRLALRFAAGYVAEPLAVHHREAADRLSVEGLQATYPPFVRSLRRAMERGEVPGSAREDAVEFGNKLLLEFAGHLIASGRRAEARGVLKECSATRIFSLNHRNLSREARWPPALLRLARAVKRTVRRAPAPGAAP